MKAGEERSREGRTLRSFSLASVKRYCLRTFSYLLPGVLDGPRVT